LTTHTQIHPRRPRRIAALGAVLAAFACAATPAFAGSGGTGAGGPAPRTVAGAKAKLVNGFAVAPKQAPAKVKEVIAAANHIAKGHPYCWGGGHASFQSKCYDCSGSVSYALHGAGLVDRPHAADFAGWADRGKGRWISVYANSSHVWMTVAGLRFDTSDTPGQGPGWAKGFGYENPSAYAVRHKAPL
jgi:cell wall-associated NlpC family hydrolase